MKRYKIKAFLLWLKYARNGKISKDWLFQYGWQWVRKVPKNKEVRVNKIINIYDIAKLKKYLEKLASFDENWFLKIFTPDSLGLTAWEIALLLHRIDVNEIELKNKRILITEGSGSKLADFFAKKGAIVTDLITFGKENWKYGKNRNKNVSTVVGDLRNLPFEDNYFYMIISLSSIQLLDVKEEKLGFYNKKNFWLRSKRAIREMSRVLKNKGLIYLTTDFYLSSQKEDNLFKTKNKPIRCAYVWDRLPKFVNFMNKLGIKIKFNIKMQENRLKVRSSKSNFRGRYFTTAAFMGKIRKKKKI
jgi:ubiquinone/menaquinone biosynthesis C-methylase UbiE